MIYRALYAMPSLIIALSLATPIRPDRTSAQDNLDRAPLIYNAPVTARLGKGETHRYPLILPAGQYVEVEAIALSGDITIELLAPGGSKLMKMRALNGVPEGNSVSAAAAEASTFFVVIAARDSQKDGVEYQAMMTESRPANEADRDHCLGEYLFSTGEEIYDLHTKEGYLAALDKYRAAFPYYEKAQDWFGAARAVETMGESLYYLSDYRESLASFEKALEYIRRVKRTTKSLSLEAQITSNIGAIADSQYDKQKSLLHFLHAGAVYHELKNRLSEANILSNIGNIFTTTGQPDEAFKWYERSLSILKELNSEQQIASVLNSRGAAKYALEKYEEAIEEQTASLALWQKSNNPGKQGWTLANLAANHNALNRPHSAIELLQEALPLIKKGGDQRGEAFALHYLGDAHRLLNQPDLALDYYQQALRLRQSRNEKILEAYSLSKIAETELSRGNPEEALLQSNRALGLVEQVRGQYSNPHLGASYSSSTHHYFAEHIALLLKLHKQKPEANFDEEAFLTSERSYARSLLESLAGFGGVQRASLPPGLIEREATLKKAIDLVLDERAAIMKTAASASQNEKMLGVQSELRQKITEMDALQGEIRAFSPSALRPELLGPTQIRRELLSSETVLLEYFVAKDRVYLFALTGEADRPLEVFEIDKLKEIEEKAEFFRLARFENPEELRRRISYQNPAFVETVEFLSQKLLAPVKSLLNKRKIRIVSDGCLQQIPFAALPDPSRSSPNIFPMMVEHEIAQLPSASAAVWLRKAAAARPSATGGAAVIADPVFSAKDRRIKRSSKIEPPTISRLKGISDYKELLRGMGGVDDEDLSRLTASRLEAQAIIQFSPGKNLLALDFDANRRLVMNGSLRNYRYIHFGTHAFVDDRLPGLSWLALSRIDRNGREQQGFLRLYDIYQLQLDADLVVLGACRTGLGQKLLGEGMIGLSKGFLYAGVPQVLTSLWDVPDQATARFMERFYRHLLKTKQPPADALRAAQLETWKHPNSSAPFFWAAFSLQGSPEK